MDNDLFISACRGGATQLESALRTLYREIGPALQRDCQAAVKDAALARDLVQETLIKVWQRCATFRGEAALVHWIKGILRRTIIDFMRARQPETALDDEEGEMLPEVQQRLEAISRDANFDPRRLLEQRDIQACYLRCRANFEAASPAYAAVMRWHVEDGLEGAEIAELLGRTPGATRELLSQVRAKVRVHFADWYRMVSQLDADDRRDAA